MMSILPESQTAQTVRLNIQKLSGLACDEINAFASEALRTRGERIGSGMGTLLEALWGYKMNNLLLKAEEGVSGAEIVWLSHQYNDFACIARDAEWRDDMRDNEYFRIEAKSMNLGADEAKGHFDELQHHLGDNDLLLVLLWRWRTIDSFRMVPYIADHFLDLAKPVAALRDLLHVARGGSFVDPDSCPDGHPATECKHAGEPLNAKGTRERISGPKSTRVSQGTSHSSNFGGLVRMLKTNGLGAKEVFNKVRHENDAAHHYISFIHEALPDEELKRYSIREWKDLASSLGLDTSGSKKDIASRIKAADPDYKESLRSQ